jgi:hypothetical protein
MHADHLSISMPWGPGYSGPFNRCQASMMILDECKWPMSHITLDIEKMRAYDTVNSKAPTRFTRRFEVASLKGR